MNRLLSVVLLAVCCAVSIAAPARGQERSTTRVQPVVLEIQIIELTGAQPDKLENTEGEALNRLLQQGKARITASLRVRTLTGEDFSVRVGERVPIQTSMLPTFRPSGPHAAPGSGEPAQPQFSAGIPQITYENTALNVQGRAIAAPDGMLDVILKIEMSGLDRGSGSLTPTFTQRSLSDVVRMKESDTAMIMGLTQEGASSSAPARSEPGAVNLPRGSLIVLLTTKPVR
jgi:hypothetical protein